MLSILSGIPHLCATGKHICIRCLGTIGCEEYFENDHMHYVCAEEFEQFPMSSPSHFESFRPIDRMHDTDTGLVSSKESTSPKIKDIND